MAEAVEVGVTSKMLARSSPATLKGRKHDCSWSLRLEILQRAIEFASCSTPSPPKATASVNIPGHVARKY